MLRKSNYLTALLMCTITPGVAAHHGLMEYDTSSLITLSGKVVDFELMDPHSVLFVDVQHDDGSVVHWVVEGGAANGIVSSSVTREDLAAGPNVNIEAFVSKDGKCAPRCRAAGRYLRDDRLVV